MYTNGGTVLTADRVATLVFGYSDVGIGGTGALHCSADLGHRPQCTGSPFRRNASRCEPELGCLPPRGAYPAYVHRIRNVANSQWRTGSSPILGAFIFSWSRTGPTRHAVIMKRLLQRWAVHSRCCRASVSLIIRASGSVPSGVLSRYVTLMPLLT